MTTREKDTATCAACGIIERIELLDAKPDDPKNPEGCNWTRLECIACYGSGWECASYDTVKLSIAPKLKPHYARYLERKKEEDQEAARRADRIDGYDRDDTGESPDF